MIKLQATAIHPTFKEGDEYEVEAIQAASDLYLKRAMEPEKEMLGTTEVRQKRKYKRRDLVSE